MTLKKELEKDLLAAMKSKDETRKNVLAHGYFIHKIG